jgi:hypothetical protein
MTDEFNQQFEIALSAGFKIPVNDLVTIRPKAEFNLALTSLFDSGIDVYTPVNGTQEAAVSIFLFRIGADIAFNLNEYE